MDTQPSLKVRAEVLRRAQALKRQRAIARSSTPWATVGRTPGISVLTAEGVVFALDRDGLIILSGENVPQPRKVERQMQRDSVRPKRQGRDDYGVVNVPGTHKVYKEHFRTRTYKGVRIIGNRRMDAWARERSIQEGRRRLALLSMERAFLEPLGTPQGIGDGVAVDTLAHGRSSQSMRRWVARQEQNETLTAHRCINGRTFSFDRDTGKVHGYDVVVQG